MPHIHDYETTTEQLHNMVPPLHIGDIHNCAGICVLCAVLQRQLCNALLRTQPAHQRTGTGDKRKRRHPATLPQVKPRIKHRCRNYGKDCP